MLQIETWFSTEKNIRVDNTHSSVFDHEAFLHH